VRTLSLCRQLPVLQLAIWTAAPVPASADEVLEQETQPQAEAIDLVPDAPSMKGLRLYGEETISVLADFGPADASEFSTKLGLRAGTQLGESVLVRARAVGEASFFAYDGDRSELETDLGVGDLFERLYDAEFALGGAVRLPLHGSLFGITPNWSIFAEGSADLAWEDGASLADAVRGSGTLGVGLELDPHLDLALGVDVGSKIDGGGAKVSPVFGFRWRIREGMRLESKGIGLMFAVDLHPELEFQLRGSYESDRYRLDDDGALPDQTLRQRAAPVLVALRWAPTKRWRFTGGAGSVVYQQWRVEADSGGGSSSVDAGPAALLWLRIEHRF
jgi:hypothetical protein